jgi:hypothetical protein
MADVRTEVLDLLDYFHQRDVARGDEEWPPDEKRANDALLRLTTADEMVAWLTRQQAAWDQRAAVVRDGEEFIDLITPYVRRDTPELEPIGDALARMPEAERKRAQELLEQFAPKGGFPIG